MKLCVGAVSRRVVEEAAWLGVHQIVASRRQVDVGTGYTGYDQESLVAAIRERSDKTKVVRDHGGPNQNEFIDDGVTSMLADVAAGFDAVHLDVCKLDRHEQIEALLHLVNKLDVNVPFELGGEHDDQMWTDNLVHEVTANTGRIPTYVVLETGAHIWADRQRGVLLAPFDEDMNRAVSRIRDAGMLTKAHNFDWVGDRTRYRHALDAYNLAPEIAGVEVDAWLTVMPIAKATKLLDVAYGWGAWRRWFTGDQGTFLERARCGARYVLEFPVVQELIESLPGDRDAYVRHAIRDAILHG